MITLVAENPQKDDPVMKELSNLISKVDLLQARFIESNLANQIRPTADLLRTLTNIAIGEYKAGNLKAVPLKHRVFSYMCSDALKKPTLVELDAQILHEAVEQARLLIKLDSAPVPQAEYFLYAADRKVRARTANKSRNQT